VAAKGDERQPTAHVVEDKEDAARGVGGHLGRLEKWKQ
jgi:hypothetical protein